MIKGFVHKFGDNIDTDVIIPARYLNLTDNSELAKHCMEDIDKNFIKNVRKGDIIVAKENFGCGSSREHAPIVLKENGIELVIAKSFARIFYRNAINIGLAILECSECVDCSDSSDVIEVDLSKGIVKNINKNKTFAANAFPDFISEIIKNGGLVNYIQKNSGKLG